MIAAFSQIAQSIRALFHLLDKAMRLQVAFLVGLSLANMLIEIAATLSVVVLLFRFTDPGFSLNNSSRLQFLAAYFPERFSINIPGLIGLIIAAYAVKNLLRVLEVYHRSRLSEDASAGFSRRLLSSYLRAPYAIHLQNRSTELIDAVWRTSDVTVRVALDSFMRMVGDGMVALGIVIVLLRTSPGPTLIFACSLGVTFLFLLRVLHVHFGSFGEKLRVQFVTLLHLLQNGFQGIAEVKLFQQESFFEQRYEKARNQMGQLYTADGVYRFLPQIALEFMSILAFGAIGLFAYYSVDRAALLPMIGTYAFCGIRLLPSAYKILEAVNQMRTEGPMLSLLQKEMADAADRSSSGEKDSHRLQPALPLTVTGLSFAYDDASTPGGPACQNKADTWQMKDVSFELRPGVSYAIVGESGSGKTTLLHILAGLLEATGGEILSPAGRLTDVRREWQRCVGYVAQEPFILDDTIKTNIILDDRADNPLLLSKVVEAARLSEWVDSLPQGLETMAGERGRQMSGGQRQRIAISRALYKQPDILLFDEPTSALDVVTENALEDSLLSLQGNTTRVIVTHRIETARRCDHIFFLAKGRLAGSGDYETLLRECAQFHTFAGQMAQYEKNREDN